MSAQDYVGKRVTIIGDHPHAGESGVVDRVEIANLIRKEGLVVKLDDGWSECFVFSVTNLMVHPDGARKRRR